MDESIKTNEAIKTKNILLCFTGSVATIKDKDLVDNLLSKNTFSLKLIYSNSSVHFSTLLKDSLILKERSYRECQIIFDSDEWLWREKGDLVLHIQLRRWADIAVVCPLSANSLAKLSGGFCDNTITLVLRAWPFHNGKIAKPVIICPAMNTEMYLHPITEQQLGILKGWGFKVVGPVSKLLACQEVGLGAMASVDEITACISQIAKEGLIKKTCDN